MADTGIVFDHGTGGVLQVFRTEEELAAAESSARVLAEFGVAHSIVGAQDVMAIEPALRAATVRLAGGLHLPDDETGDCHKFTVALAEPSVSTRRRDSDSTRTCNDCCSKATA